MDPTNTAALRVVLNVMEVSAPMAELQQLREHTERRMKAYHFQQTMRRFSEAYLDMVNRMDPGDLLGESHGEQYLVNILDPRDDDSDILLGPRDDDSDTMGPMVFVEPSLGDESELVLDSEDRSIQLAHLEELAEFFGTHPDLYDAFLNKVTFCPCPIGNYNTPDYGIIAF